MGPRSAPRSTPMSYRIVMSATLRTRFSNCSSGQPLQTSRRRIAISKSKLCRRELTGASMPVSSAKTLPNRLQKYCGGDHSLPEVLADRMLDNELIRCALLRVLHQDRPQANDDVFDQRAAINC